MSKKPTHLDPKILRETLLYDPLTGRFSSIKPNQRNPAGFTYSVKDVGGYATVPYGKRRVRAHRAAWVMMTGEQPNIVDHINGITHDNSWHNLRNVSAMENCLNRQSHRVKNGTYVPLEDMDQYAHGN